jgi:hypothetical protein
MLKEIASVGCVPRTLDQLYVTRWCVGRTIRFFVWRRASVGTESRRICRVAVTLARHRLNSHAGASPLEKTLTTGIIY